MCPNSDSAGPVLLPPCRVLRAWPSEWRLHSLLQAKCDTTFPKPSRYLHPALEVRRAELSQGGGRCVVAARPCKAGELVLVDAPIVTADSRKKLLENAFERANDEDDAKFRKILLSLCGDEADCDARAQALDEGLVPAGLVDRIIRHNYHVVDIAPRDGHVPEGGKETCGLWPLGSIVNHSLHPNVTRFFVGHASCYRLLRDVSVGEEILDNYLDPRIPHSERKTILRNVRGMGDEGPDEFDAPEEILADIELGRAEVERLLIEEGRVDEAFQKFAEVTARCSNGGHRDPAFVEIFRAQAEMASQFLTEDDRHLQLECLHTALGCVTARECVSAVSCLLLVELLCGALDLEATEWVSWAEALARDHFRRVYGSEEGIFEKLNPVLSQRLHRAHVAAQKITATSLNDLD